MTDRHAETWRSIPLRAQGTLAAAPEPADPPLIAAVVIWVGSTRYQIPAEEASALGLKIERAARDAEIGRALTGGYPGGDEHEWRRGVTARAAHRAACRGCTVCASWREDPR